jgi:hypothetical protein
VAQLPKLVTIEAVEAVFGSEPHEAFGVLDDRIDGVLRESVLEAVALYTEWRRGIRNRGAREQANREKRSQEQIGRAVRSPR